MKVGVGVAGGIAAYKAAEIVRELQQRGLDVQVIMTASAQEFVRPLTFAALSGKKVITGMFGGEGREANVESAIEHIAVAQSIDLLLVAPATADILAKFANGIADDFLTTTYLATKAPVVVVPAMNVNMWQHPATQENLIRLRARGVHIVEPESGYLACGMTGPGRLASNDAIISRVMDVLAASADHAAAKEASQDLTGEVVLVTAGPTREAIDPVRYISNRSSGKMGYAIAEAARDRGARVVLVSGPTNLKAPDGIEVVKVSTVAEMREAVLGQFADASVVIKAAAPADFRLKQQATQKIHKTGDGLTLTLEPTEDILRELGQRKGDRVLVGFAAETEDLLTSAGRKLKVKNLDLIVGNDVSGTETGFDSDYNSVVILGHNGYKRELARLPKREVAAEILNEVVKLRARSHARA
jgi:phosphopantothenoylcysteine decarboxylase/phosphopantothenate--cysteine ligase